MDLPKIQYGADDEELEDDDDDLDLSNAESDELEQI